MGFEYKSELKGLLTEYMEILEQEGKTENRGDGYWDCPFCGSGTKDNQTAAFHINGVNYNCFSCGERGDIFDLVAYMEQLTDRDWKAHYNRAVKIMRPFLDGTGIKRERVSPDTFLGKPSEIDYSDYLQRCHLDVSDTDYFHNRGLSDRTISRFSLGYDKGKNIITIPYNSDLKGYVHRVLWNSDNKYCKHGNELFNIEALYSPDYDVVFIVEGQIDALSIEEVGFCAVGLGGVNETDKLVEQLKRKPSSKVLFLALDKDKAGKAATGRLIEKLAEGEIDNHYIVVSELYRKFKDANEYLVDDKERFKETLNTLVKWVSRNP